MRKSVTAILLFSCISATSLQAQQTVIAVQKGQKFKAESTLKSNSSAEVMGQAMETTANSTSETLYEITGTGQNEISLQLTITKMLVNSSSMGQEMNYDSDKDKSGPMADVFGPKINKAESIVIDSKGMITKKDDTGDNNQGLMMGLNNLNPTTTDLFVPALIGRELKVGDIFTDTSSTTKEKYSSRDSGTYRITAIDNGIAAVSYTGTQVLATVIDQMGMEMVTNANNTIKTEMQVDVKTGLVLVKATVIETNVSIDAGGMTIPATGKTIATVKVTPVQ
ncbi:MAG TPA: hypothetical protein VFV31_15920 [Chitinophagaceae bacterium]|nr:hypothetical protein [Chitinophagaceae bacterium]